MYQGILSFPGFPEFFNGMMLNFNPGPPGAPAPPDGSTFLLVAYAVLLVWF